MKRKDAHGRSLSPVKIRSGKNAKFEDVYGNVDNQHKVVQVFKKVLRKRKIFMEIAEKTAKNHPSS